MSGLSLYPFKFATLEVRYKYLKYDYVNDILM